MAELRAKGPGDALGPLCTRALAWAGARPRLAVIACGALAATGFEPLHLRGLMLLGVGGLLALVRRAASVRGAALLGWLWGLGHFVVALGWIATAFTYQAKMPVALGWLGVGLVAAWCAVFPALAAAGGWWFRRREGALVLGFAACWIIAEWLRSWLLTGFPWDPLGAALLGGDGHQGAAGLAPWLGTYGLSGLAALASGVVARDVARWLRDPRQRGRAVANVLLLIGAFFVIPDYLAFGGGHDQGHMPFTLVQPDFDQSVLDDPAHFPLQFGEEARAMGPLPAGPRLVLWPESGVPDFLGDGYPAWAYADTFAGNPAAARARLAGLVGAQKLLLTGAIEPVFAADRSRIVAARNVITAIDDHGAIAGEYAKAHPVPFGEYLPLRPLLTPLGIARLVPGDGDILPGPGPQTLDLGRFGKAGMQICYEIIFSGHVVDAAHRPDYLLAPSNDGWFGAWGPPQHLAQARLRAIEEGLPVLRATTNGISAVVDADGVVRAKLPRGRAGQISGLIPPPHPATLFARYGNAVPLGWAIALLGIATLVLRRKSA